MGKFENYIEEKLMPAVTRFTSIPIIAAIKNGMVTSMPFLVVGSIGMLIKSFPITAWAEFMKTPFLGTTIGGALSVWSNVTFDLFGLISIICISNYYAKSLKVEPIFASIISIVSFVMVTPLSIDTGEKTISAISLSFLGAQGLFVGIIMVFISVRIYYLCIKNNIVIKMPDSVPANVTKAFSAMVPIFIVLVVGFIIRFGTIAMGYESLHELIDQIIATPLKSLGGSLPGICIAVFTMSFLWFFGIHGSSIVGGIMNPICLTLLADNLAATEAGLEPVHIITKTFYDMMKLGGAGFTLPLLFMFIFLAKSEQLRQVGKVAFIPGLFNINEPLIFGAPIVMNPILMVPFCVVPVVVVLITYFSMSLGLVPLTTGALVPWTMPIVIHGFLTTNSIQGAILQVLLLIVAGFIYYPFFKAYDKQLSKLEVKENEQAVL